MGLTTVNAPGPTAVDLAIVAVLDEFSGALGWLWEFSYTLVSVWVVVLLLAPVVRHGQGRLRLLWDYGLALVVSFALVAGISALGGTSLAETVDALVTADPPPVYAAARLAVVTAVIVTASPHVTRPFSVVGRVTCSPSVPWPPWSFRSPIPQGWRRAGRSGWRQRRSCTWCSARRAGS